MKKKEALNSLVKSGRISQYTFDLFNKEIDEAIAEIEHRKGILLEKMNNKMKELEEQVKILERLLATFEIQHVSGEIEEEAYQRELKLISMELESTKQELNLIKETVNRINEPQIQECANVHEKAEVESLGSVETSNLSALKVEANTETHNPSENTQEILSIAENKVEEVSNEK